MSKRAFFLKSKFDGTIQKCADCSHTIQGDMYWNPNPRAKKKQICDRCYIIRQYGSAAMADHILELKRNQLT